MNASLKKWISLAVVLVLALLAYQFRGLLGPREPGEGFVQGNGRIEAVEIDVATKVAGRVDEILAREGEFVKAGQVVARMQAQGERY